jgi:hypothetical protein
MWLKHRLGPDDSIQRIRAVPTGVVLRSRAILNGARDVRSEAAMRFTVWLALPAYHVANAAAEALLWVIEHSRVERHHEDDDPPASYWRAKALLYLGVLSLRVTRAAMAVIADGYEQEAMTYKRALMEAHSRMQRVVADETGSYAREWLRGRGCSPRLSAVSR